MKILHHVQSLDQTQGGLAVAVADLCSALADGLCDVVLTTAEKSENQVPVSTKINPVDLPVSNSVWSHFLPAQPFEPGANFDLAHRHGLWSRSMRVMADFANSSNTPLVMSPHGMLEPWALRQHSLRKQIAWRWYQRNVLEQAAAFHATSDAEAAQIRKLGFFQPIAVIPNGVPAGWNPSFAGGSTERTAVFLSRIHRKKGLELLLQAWAVVSPKDWRLKILGEGEGAYFRKINQLIEKLNLTRNVKMLGPVYDEGKWRALGEAELFILPSFSENFGIVIAEALESGTPVITTTATPWKLIEQAGCGWCVEPTVEAIATALNDAISRTERELFAMGQAGSRLINEQFRWVENAKKMSEFYRWISGEGERERPTFVIK